MKVLYLVRHAKSSWKDLSLKDHDRPLNARGKRDAPFMGGQLKKQGICPDLIISSSAKRAWKTAVKIGSELSYKEKKIVWAPDMYESSESRLLSMIRKQKDRYDSIMLVGHNPELTSFSNMLSDQFIYNIPTTGISCIKFKVSSWKDVEAKSGVQVFFDYPKRYLSTESP